jgi:hypothetical protein
MLCVLPCVLQAQFDMANEAIAVPSGKEGAQCPATPAAAAAEQPTAEPSAPSTTAAATPPPSTTTTAADARAKLGLLPFDLFKKVTVCLHEGYHDVEQLASETLAALKVQWGEQLHPIWQQLVAMTCCKPRGWYSSSQPGQFPCSPTSPLELDQAMLRYGEPSQRLESRTPPWMQVDSMGFLDGLTAPQGTNMVSRARRSEHHKFASAELPQIRTRHNTLRQRQ